MGLGSYPEKSAQIFRKFRPYLVSVSSLDQAISAYFRLFSLKREMTQIFREGTNSRLEKCSREESNLHGFPHTVLSRTRLPFRHVSVFLKRLLKCAPHSATQG